MIQLSPLSQMDFRWKNKKLGTDPASTIGKYGCLLTCMTMVVDYYGCNETPASLNDHMLMVGGFQGALIIPALLPDALPAVKYHKYVQCSSPPAPLADIDASLAAGQPVIVKVDYSKVQGIQDHWIVLYAKQGSDYLIQDPWPNPPDAKPVTLTSRYGFAGSPAQIILAALWFAGTPGVQPEPPQPAPVPNTGFAVYAAADSLALRQAPAVADNNLIERMPVGTKMWSLEPQDTTLQKIGQINQWLNVQNTADGFQGYTAAWFVVASPYDIPAVEPTPPPQPAPQPGPDVLVVYAAADGLAVRSQPQVATTNLIRRTALNAQFAVLEPADQASQKIGQANQWLSIRDIQGEQGYVAAWLVSTLSQQPALGVSTSTNKPPAPPLPGDKLVVRAAEDSLALRNQPVIADATLIKRVPLATELLVLEPADSANTKLGVVNQWLNVRDIYGVEGYVAAWFVVKNPPPGIP